MKIFCALALLAGLTYAQDTATLTIDATKIDKFAETVKRYNQYYKTTMNKPAQDLAKTVDNAFAQAIGKITLDFGNTIPPFVRAWSRALKTIQVNDTCDVDQAID
jgi:hypothetical protein